MNFLKLSVHVFCLAEKAKLRRTNSRTNCQQNKITVCLAKRPDAGVSNDILVCHHSDLTATQTSDGPKIQVRWRHVLRRYSTIFLRKISDAFSKYLGRVCVAGTLKRISYEIHFGLRKYVDSHTNVATESWCQVHQVTRYHTLRSHVETREAHAKHTSNLITLFSIN